MIKILITGANGFIGRYLLNTLKKNISYKLYATSLSSDAYPSEGYEYIKIDLIQKEVTLKAIRKIKPDIIINTAAMSSIPECETNPNRAFKINVEAVRHLVEIAQIDKTRLIHISTDFIFEGNCKQLYTEIDTPKPINTYGKTKLEAENIILEQLPNSLILRVAVVYGKPLLGQHTNIVELIKDKLDKNEQITLVTDQSRTPTFVEDICRAIQTLISGNHSGVYHISGSELFTIYELGLEIAKHMRKNPELIKGISTGLDLNSARRPLSTPLSNKKAKESFGYKTTSIKSYIQNN